MAASRAGRTALVTGAGGGIGRAAALALARAGAAVAAADIAADAAEQTAQSVRELGVAALALTVDVSDPQAVREAVERTVDELGPVEILVNCAGWDEFRPFLSSDEAFWRRIVDVNYEGTLRTTHAVLHSMHERGYGRLVNIASDAARVGSAQEAVYAGAKAAVVAFTKTIARESARRGVTANVVCPGPTRTPLLASMAAAAPDSERLLAALERAVPMRRLGEPEEVAAAIAFLASEEAGYITGQTLSVSGGLTMA
ncbi:MAG TPA: SDR family oxidoreductase [Solirubrobacteraceae bacterium]|jgi:2-hydroxycyclohexanecarboxyl-CoA dehydrogenase